MAGRRYRVLKRLPWIEGGKPGPGFQWEGGESLIYEPGETIYLDDSELAGIYHYLEALDDDGRVALDEVRAEDEAPAQFIATADLDPATVALLTHLLDEKRRAYGGEIERTYVVLRDGSEKLLSTRVHPAKPRPGVVYGENGLPDSYATAIQKRRWESEQKAQEEQSRGRRNARAKSLKAKKRAQAIADFALKAARKSDELAENPKRLARYVLAHWRTEWGQQLAPS